MIFRITMRRSGSRSPWNSPADGIRVLALLPKDWRKELRQVTGGMVLTIRTEEDLSPEQFHTELREACADPSVGHLEVVACDVLDPRE